MFKKIYIPMISFLLFAIVAVAGEESVNFSGDWKLDRKKSDLSESRLFLAKITITQKEDSLIARRTYENMNGEQYPFTEKLALDGKESEIIVYDIPRASTANLSEDGKSATITSKMTFYREGSEVEWTLLETWTLTEKGTILSINFNSKSPRGDSEVTYFYNKTQSTQ